jgi:hypothetical protein
MLHQLSRTRRDGFLTFPTCFHRSPPSLYIEGVLPLIAMAATSCKMHSIVRKTSASDLLLGDPALALMNKHASHVWSLNRLWIQNCLGLRPRLRFSLSTFNLFIVSFKKNELNNLFLLSINKSLKRKWASLACHETGSLVVQA